MENKIIFKENLDINEMKKNKSIKIVAIYFIFSFLWIIFSDKILHYLFEDISMYKKIHFYKEWVFLIITSGFLYFIIRREYSKLNKLFSEISAKNHEILYMDEELTSKKKLLEEIYNYSNTSIMTWDLEGRVIDINHHFTKLLGYEKDEIVNKNWIEIMIPVQERHKFDIILSELFDNNEVLNFENEVISKDGRNLNMIWNDSIIINPINKEKMVVSFGIDVTNERDQEKRIYKMAFYDKLTDLPNQEAFKIDIDDLILNKSPFTLYFIDIDHFKRLNDIHGHKYGDLFLRKYSNVLINEFNEFRIYRWLGDEFLIIEETNSYEKINATIKLIMKYSCRKWLIGDVEYNSTVSIGITRYPFDGQDISTLQKNIEMALYKAKDKGRFRWEFYDNKLQEEMIFHSNIEKELNRALKNDFFEIYFQPVYNLSNNSIAGIEALLRWSNNVLGNVSTEKFISIAEQTGQIIKIDKWVVKTIFKMISETFNHDNLCLISINLSAQSFNSNDFYDFLKKQVVLFNINTRFVEFEMTEHTFINDIKRSEKIIKSIKSLGFKIALDDFGTKYSSLNYLGKLQFDILKIDKSYIDNILNNKVDRIIVDQIIELSHKLGLKTVAEGIEDKKQKDILIEYGCDFGQGYYLSRPVSLEKILIMLNLEKNYH